MRTPDSTPDASSPEPDPRTERFRAALESERFLLVAFVAAACRGRIRGQDRIDDVVQETVTIAWARRFEFDESRPLGPWLRGIAANVVFGTLRMEFRRQRILERSKHELDRMRALGRQFDRLDRSSEAEDLATGLRACVDALPDPQRDVIERHYFLGQPLVSVAACLGLAEEAVFKRASRARAFLAKCLERKHLMPDWLRQRAEDAT